MTSRKMSTTGTVARLGNEKGPEWGPYLLHEHHLRANSQRGILKFHKHGLAPQIEPVAMTGSYGSTAMRTAKEMAQRGAPGQFLEVSSPWLSATW